VRFEDEEFEGHNYEEGYEDDENRFARGGRFDRRRHRRADFEDRGFQHGCRHYDDQITLLV
jgi:hypothetical protein